MSFQKFGAGRGVDWLKQSIDINLKNPGIFLANAVIAIIIIIVGAIIPLLQIVTLPMAVCVMYAGLVWAYREEDHGRKAEIGHLFAAFQQPGKIGPVLMLSLPWIAAMIAIFVLALVFGGAAILGAFAGASANSAAGIGAGVGITMLLFFLICLAIMLAVAFLTFFAIPRVMFDNVDAFAAMKESLSACIGNFLPLLVYGLIVFVAQLVLGFVLMLIPFLGQLVLGVAVTMLNAAFMYVCYRDVFSAGSAPVDYMPPAPPPPM